MRARSTRAFSCMTIAFLSILSLYVLSWIVRFSKSANLNLSASRVRDDEELRFAKALSTLNDRRRAKGRQAFRYGTQPVAGAAPFPGGGDPPGLVFAILAPNRWNHEIDGYEPSYLLESAVSLLTAIEYDLAVHGPRYAFVNVTICPTVDRTETFSDLAILARLLPDEAIKRRLKSLDSSSLSCRTILDAASCIQQSVSPLSKNSFLVLLEDDLVSESQSLFQQLWDVLAQLNSSAISNHVAQTLGAVLLRIPDSDLEYTWLDWDNVIQLIFLSCLLTLVILIPCFRRWYEPFRFRTNFIFVLYTFFICMLTVNFIGRLSWMYHVLATLSNKQFLARSSRPWSESSAASILFPSRVAYNLSVYLNSLSCDALDAQDAFGLKSRVISEFLNTNAWSVYVTWPSIFRHRGLYSIYKRDIHNPFELE